MIDAVEVWGLRLAPLTLAQTVDEARKRVETREPSFFITANVHYAMLTGEMDELRHVNAHASFLVADGAPLVWASRWNRRPLPERVAGSDLIFALSEMAALQGFRVFFLGGAPGVAEEAALRLADRYSGLQVVGIESPPFHDPTPEEHDRMIDRVQAASPDILIVASTMPRGEIWIANNYQRLGVPLCINVGAGIDFAAGRVRRAPRRLQVLGMEWAYRLWLEPRRLYSRYARNARFALAMIARDLARGVFGRRADPPLGPSSLAENA